MLWCLVVFEKVSKLKKFGIFLDFSWNRDTSNLARFNLVYGWNKSGKTTLSKAFVACEKKTTEFKQYPGDGEKRPGNGEFEIKISNGQSVKNSNCQNVAKQVRVFNKDFTEDNVSFDPNDPKGFSNPIVYVSKENIKSKEKLKKLKNEATILSQKHESAKNNFEKNENVEDKFRVSTALSIKNTLRKNEVQDKFRDYNKSNIKETIEHIGIENFSKLSEQKFIEKKELVDGDPRRNQKLLDKYGFTFSYKGKNLQNFLEVHNELSTLLSHQVVAEIITRFKNNPELNRWAEQGFELHKNMDEKNKCLFCQNEFPTGFWESLLKHFSNDYAKLLKNINSLMELSDLKRKEILSENLALYPDLQNQYKSKAEEFNNTVNELNTWIDEATDRLIQKQKEPLSVITSSGTPKEFRKLYDNAIDGLNSVIKDHNSRVNKHKEEVSTAKKELEKHFIAEAIEEQDYLEIRREYRSSIEARDSAKKNVQKNNELISCLEKKTSNIGEAVQEINQYLEEFFGRKEILLELDVSKKGYVIKRDGNIAYNLSEGEKNAIAFAYFIAKTEEAGFGKESGVVVIDDPVSSFDSNFIHHCFSLIKNHFGKVGQLIILTHNFELFNLVKHWFQEKNQKIENHNKKTNNKATKKPIPCGFFMVKNEIKNEKRCASIVPLDETLKNFNSEYNFLFSRLKQFVEEGKENYEDLYTIGNIARRFLEIYVNFKIPKRGNLKSKLDQIDIQNISQTEVDRVYKLINEFSHGSDPVSAIEHKDKNEIQNAVEILMKIVSESDKKHFDSLVDSLDKSIKNST